MRKNFMMKEFPVTTICREDILAAFNKSGNFEIVKKRIFNMNDSEMLDLATDLADDYCEQLFWSSLETIFEMKFMNEKEEIKNDNKIRNILQ